MNPDYAVPCSRCGALAGELCRMLNGADKGEDRATAHPGRQYEAERVGDLLPGGNPPIGATRDNVAELLEVLGAKERAFARVVAEFTAFPGAPREHLHKLGLLLEEYAVAFYTEQGTRYRINTEALGRASLKADFERAYPEVATVVFDRTERANARRHERTPTPERCPKGGFNCSTGPVCFGCPNA